MRARFSTASGVFQTFEDVESKIVRVRACKTELNCKCCACRFWCVCSIFVLYHDERKVIETCRKRVSRQIWEVMFERAVYY